MKKNLIIFVILLNQTLFSQDGWHWVNPYPTANYLTSAQFFNSNTGYVCGGRGEFLKTSDAGITWQYNRIDSLYTDYPEIFFLDQNTGFVFVYDVWKTTNAGVNWEKINFSEGNGIHCIKFIDQNSGFALTNDTGKVYRTTNAGNSWQLTVIPGGKFFSNIAFTGNTAYIIGVKDMIPKLVKSTDSGQNWLDVSMGINDSMYIDKISIPNNENLIICGQKGYGFPTKILKSTDAGASWNLYQMNNLGYFVTDLEFTDAQNGTAVGYEGYRLYTTNGGVNWIENRSIDTSTIIFDLSKAGSNLISIGSVGFIEKTVNSGVNWERVSRSFTSDHLYSVSFGDANTGLVLGLRGSLFRTTNKGLNWNSISIPGISALHEVKMANSQVAYLTGGSKVLKSTNSGLNWLTLMDSLNFWFESISLFDHNNVIVEAGNKVYKTSNGGNSWDRIWNCTSTQLCFSISDIAITSTNRIILAGGVPQQHSPVSSALLLSTNGGSSYSLIFDVFSDGRAMNTVYMFNQDIGFASGGYGIRLKTTDGFNTFIDYGNNIPGNGIGSFSSISFLDSLNGLSLDGYINKTTNGGVNWSISSTKSFWLNSICFTSQNNAIAVGHNGSILKMDNFISGIPSPEILPNKFILYPNYPNPFNSSTVIKFDLPVSGYTNLILYDITGKVSAVIINGYNSSGLHQLEYNFSDLASGVYFLQLRQGQYSQSRKIVLIK